MLEYILNSFFYEHPLKFFINSSIYFLKLFNIVHSLSGKFKILSQLLNVIQTTSESAVKKATLLSDMHIRNLRQKMQLRQRTDEVVKKLEVYMETIILIIHPEKIINAYIDRFNFVHAKVSQLTL